MGGDPPLGGHKATAGGHTKTMNFNFNILYNCAKVMEFPDLYFFFYPLFKQQAW